MRLIASKGLARISHRKKIVNDAYPVYEYDPTGRDGVDAYIIGTGTKLIAQPPSNQLRPGTVRFCAILHQSP